MTDGKIAKPAIEVFQQVPGVYRVSGGSAFIAHDLAYRVVPTSISLAVSSGCISNEISGSQSTTSDWPAEMAEM
jgi:hypothetical protein